MKYLKSFLLISFLLVYCINIVMAINVEAERHLKNGKTLLQNNKPQEALVEFQLALAADLSNSDAMFCIGLCYHKMGQYDLAIQNYEKLIKSMPTFPPVYYYTALAYYDKGDTKKAIEFLDKAIVKSTEIGEKYVEPYYMKSLIYYDAGNLYEAIKTWEKILGTVDKNHASSEINLAIAYFYTNRSKDAITRGERAFRNNPRSQIISFNLGWIYLKTGDVIGARKTFQKTIEIDPNTPFAWKADALINLMDNNPDKALELIQKAITADGADPSAFAIAGEIWEKKGDKKKAIECYQKSVNLDKNDPEPQKALQRLLY